MIRETSSTLTSPVKAAGPELRKAAIAFEAVILRQLIGELRKGGLGNDIFGSSANSTYRELADARTADALARRGAIGIAAMIERQLQDGDR